ncbi:MAG: NAD(P)(+) transhydrogenase (Re/Si-specific) subunit alpha, partial [Alphaproteobacteria bacterium]|nr:NAD(P)(+) transhydrogenase (Re/Si-specific) subunit alpha [Alphaproteobacteria bacterium]
SSDLETKQAETSGGYAKEMSDDYKRRQAELIAETIKKQDVVICTALIPGRAAPNLISEVMLKTMKPGSVIVDLAVEQGGNCALSEAGKIVDAYGVKIVGYRNVPSRVPVDASTFYAKNLLNFVSSVTAKGEAKLAVNLEDEIVRAITLTHQGAIIHPQFLKNN